MANGNGKRRPAPPPTSKTVRCAIYTRKSTDEGLEQELNSLDAQREAAEAYIQSQRHEGWQILPDRYDDGGFTGGNLERPALQRLLAAVDARQIDCVVIYKIDRLSRSLLDFARIMESFDQHGVSLVSVTQQMNTTNSMGRLTLNILLSFAQFEREIIAERTRDKLSAARRKGKWIGGHPVLGYDIDPKGGRLVVNKDEARRVKRIFAMYLEHQGLAPLLNELDRREWRTKRWITKSGKARGGKSFTKSSIHYLLTNVVFTGRVNHKGKIYSGEHEAIIEEDVWTAVQYLLKGNAVAGSGSRRNKHGALLRGLLHCASCGAPMVHNYTSKGSKRYRYYVCYSAQQKGWAKCETKSVAATRIESAVVSAIRKLGNDPKVVAGTARQSREQVARRIEEIREDKDATRRESRRLNAELGRLSGDESAARYDRVLAIEKEIRAAEERMARLGEELREWQGQQVDEAELARALAEFDSVWRALTTAEQARLVGLLVDRVVYHGPTNKITVSFRTAGLHELCAGEKAEK